MRVVIHDHRPGGFGARVFDTSEFTEVARLEIEAELVARGRAALPSGDVLYLEDDHSLCWVLYTGQGPPRVLRGHRDWGPLAPLPRNASVLRVPVSSYDDTVY